MTEPSTKNNQLLRETYAAFNSRDIDAALERMTSEVKWPRAFKGGVIKGPEEIRTYWTEQWSEIDPSVEPISFMLKSDSSILVEVRQIVRDLKGAVIDDGIVGHLFTFNGGLIEKMEVCQFPGAHLEQE